MSQSTKTSPGSNFNKQIATLMKIQASQSFNDTKTIQEFLATITMLCHIQADMLEESQTLNEFAANCECNQLRACIADMIEDHTSELDRNRGTCSDCDDLIKQHNEKINELKKQHDEEVEHVRPLTERIMELESEIDMLRQRNETQTQWRSQQSLTINKLNAQITEMKKQFSELMDESTSRGDKIIKLELQLANSTKDRLLDPDMEERIARYAMFAKEQNELIYARK